MIRQSWEKNREQARSKEQKLAQGCVGDGGRTDGDVDRGRQSMWIVWILGCMNLTPVVWAQPTPRRETPVSRPVVKRQQTTNAAQNTGGLEIPGRGRPQKAQIVSSTRPSKTTPKIIHVRCDDRRRYGKYCLGRIIGPQFSHQAVRCPHCSKRVLVKRLEKDWKPALFDSDLRPHMGHYRQKDRIWICRHCGYAAYAGDFFRPYSKRDMEDALRRVRRTYPDEDKIPSHYRFVAANASYVARRRSVPFFATLLLRAVWSAREEGDLARYKVFENNATQALRISLQRNLVPLPQRIVFAFQLADLLRQQGLWLEATYWLEQADLALQLARKQKQSFSFSGVMDRWILQLQQRISQRDKKIHPLRPR